MSQSTGYAMARSITALQSFLKHTACKGSSKEKGYHWWLPSKTRADYTKLFEVIKNALCARHVTVGTLGVGHFDFEVSAISASEDVLAGVTVKGCLFHFSQCLMRKLAELGLRVRFLSVDGYRNMNS